MRPQQERIARQLHTGARGYAGIIADAVFQDFPELIGRRLTSALGTVQEDLQHRLSELSGALLADEPQLLDQAVRWAKVLHAHRGVHPQYLSRSLQRMTQLLPDAIGEPVGDVLEPFLHRSLSACAIAPETIPSMVEGDDEWGARCREFLLALLESRSGDAIEQVRRLLADGCAPVEIADRLLARVQAEIGRMWLMAEIPVADEHYGSQLVSRVMSLLEERIAEPAGSAPRVLCLCTTGNRHDFGLRIVAAHLRSAAFGVMNLGGDMPIEDLGWLFTDRRFDLVAMSVSRLAELPSAKDLVGRVREIHGGAGPAVLIGGPPLSAAPGAASLLGANGTAVDGAGAVAMARKLLGTA